MVYEKHASMRSLPCRARKLNTTMVQFKQWIGLNVWCHIDRIQVLLGTTIGVKLGEIYTHYYDYLFPQQQSNIQTTIQSGPSTLLS